MSVPAESPYGYFFAFKILRALDLRLGDNAVGQKVFNTADEYQVGEALDVGPHIADGARDGDLGVAVQRGGGGHRRRRNKNQPKI